MKEEYLEIAKAEGREKLVSLIVYIRRVTSNPSSKFYLMKLGKVKQIKYKVSRSNKGKKKKSTKQKRQMIEKLTKPKIVFHLID